MESLLPAAVQLLAALGCGLLVGIERERRKGEGPGRALAGVRTFALTCVLGAATPLTGLDALVVLGGLLVTGAGVAAYLRDRSDDPGVTTEVALLLTYVIGVLCATQVALAAALAAGLTAVLAARGPMHRFAREWLRPEEMRDGTLLLALALIALPLAPDRPFWGPVLNPRLVMQLLVLLLALQALAHLAGRVLATRQALMLSALAAGVGSSSGAIATYGLAVRDGRLAARSASGAGLLSCVSTQLQLPLVALAVQPAWVPVLLVPALASGALALLWGGLQIRASEPDGLMTAADGGRMFHLPQAALVAVALAGIQALVFALGLWLGPTGERVAVGLAALAEMHGTAAAVMATSAVPVTPGAVQTLALALGVHALGKLANAWISGGRAYALALAPGLLGHTTLGVWLLLAIQ